MTKIQQSQKNTTKYKFYSKKKNSQTSKIKKIISYLKL